VSNACPFHFWKGHPLLLLSIGGPFLLDLIGISVEKFEKCGFGRLLPLAPHYVVAQQQNLGIKTCFDIF
jgi:hypothetical protein